MYRIDSSVRAPEVWVQVVETQRYYYSHECDLMMEIRFDFDYVREYLEPKSFCSGATEYGVFWAKWFVYECNLTEFTCCIWLFAH